MTESSVATQILAPPRNEPPRANETRRADAQTRTQDSSYRRALARSVSEHDSQRAEPVEAEPPPSAPRDRTANSEETESGRKSRPADGDSTPNAQNDGESQSTDDTNRSSRQTGESGKSKESDSAQGTGGQETETDAVAEHDSGKSSSTTDSTTQPADGDLSQEFKVLPAGNPVEVGENVTLAPPSGLSEQLKTGMKVTAVETGRPAAGSPADGAAPAPPSLVLATSGHVVQSPASGAPNSASSSPQAANGQQGTNASHKPGAAASPDQASPVQSGNGSVQAAVTATEAPSPATEIIVLPPQTRTRGTKTGDASRNAATGSSTDAQGTPPSGNAENRSSGQSASRSQPAGSSNHNGIPRNAIVGAIRSHGGSSAPTSHSTGVPAASGSSGTAGRAAGSSASTTESLTSAANGTEKAQSTPSGTQTSRGEAESGQASTVRTGNTASSSEGQGTSTPAAPTSVQGQQGRATTSASPIDRPEMLSEANQARLLDRISSAVRTAQREGRPLRVRLHPPELGTMQIEVSSRGGGLSARLEVQTQAVQQTVLDNLPLLRDALVQNGTSLNRIDVHLSENAGQQGADGHPDQTDGGQQEEHGRWGYQHNRDERPEDDSQGEAETAETDHTEPGSVTPRHLDELDIQI